MATVVIGLREVVAMLSVAESQLPVETLDYFAKRPPQAERDAQFALDYVKRHAKTPEQQAAVLRALEFKCDVLWSMLDALYYCYVTPGHIAPGAFVPKD